MNYFGALVTTVFLSGTAIMVNSMVNTASGRLGQGLGKRDICIVSDEELNKAKDYTSNKGKVNASAKGRDGRYSLLKLFACPFEYAGDMIGLYINKENNVGKEKAIGEDPDKMTFSEFEKERAQQNAS